MKMSKFQKSYCRASVMFAVLAILIVVLLSTGQTVFATTNAATNNTDTTAPDGTAGEDIGDLNVNRSEGSVQQATGDGTNGLSIVYNNEGGTLSSPIRILLVLTILSLAPSILIMMTSFTRIIIVLHFLRSAIGTQTTPPNQILIGLALFLTFFIMQPIFSNINENAIKPFDAGEITQEQAIEIGSEPLREFMFGQTQIKDLDLFIGISGNTYEAYRDVPFTILIPSFIISELRTAFIIGFLIYIPFIVIDMVVASVLMSMGMMMLPPTTISLPFKILLFILADGWNLVIGNLVKTFQ